MWRVYVGAVRFAAKKIAPYGAQWILDPRRCRMALLTAIIGFAIAVSPVLVPAQMTPQERRQMERLDARVQRLENGQIKMEEQLKVMAINGNKLDAMSVQMTKLVAARDEGRAYLGALPNIISTLAVLLGALFYVIDVRRRGKAGSH